jgi:hypothetical protein
VKDHRLIDERSLAFHRLIAEKLVKNPALVEHAKRNLERWLVTCSPRVRPVLLEWQAVLDGPTERLHDLLAATDENATRLRQSSPFAGLLTPAERTRILLEYQQREQVSA